MRSSLNQVGPLKVEERRLLYTLLASATVHTQGGGRGRSQSIKFTIHQINCPKWEIYRPEYPLISPSPNLRKNVWSANRSAHVLRSHASEPSQALPAVTPGKSLLNDGWPRSASSHLQLSSKSQEGDLGLPSGLWTCTVDLPNLPLW